MHALLGTGGRLIAAGSFAVAGSVVAANIAAWDGSAWSALGQGCSGQVIALAMTPNGTLFVAGRFNAAGGIGSNAAATWNDTSWSAAGAGIAIAHWGQTLCVGPSGNVLLGTVGIPGHLYQWNGASAALIASVSGALTGAIPTPSIRAVVRSRPDRRVRQSGVVSARHRHQRER